MTIQSISKQALRRLPLYVGYLKTLSKEGPANISATGIADELGLNQVQVRKDLASVSSGGRPKIGYIIEDLIAAIEQFLGCNDVSSAVIVGMGHLGKAILSYEGLDRYGVEIAAAFDIDETYIGSEFCGRSIFSVEKLKDLCKRLRVHIGIIAVPAEDAQNVCDMLIDSGILAIWNAAPVHLNVPNHILVQNENIAVSLSVLSRRLAEKVNDFNE